MADNFSFTEGTGKTGAADEIGGVLYPRVKLAQGADGTAVDVSSAAPLQVTLANTGANATAVKVDGSAVTQPMSATSLPLPTGAATESTLSGVLTTSDFDTKIGSLTETAPATDTASSGVNGRLQRIAQRLTSLIALIPAALTGSGNFKVALVESTATQTVSGTITATLSSSTNAGVTAKTSDYDTGAGVDTVTMFGIALPASGGAVQGGTSSNPIQVSVANTGANATAVKVDGSAVTQPVSISGNQAVNVAQVAGSTVSTAATGVQKVGVVGNGGSTLDASISAGTAPTNGVANLGIYNSTEPSPTTGQSVALQLDSKGRQRTVLMDAAGNTRGANVDASNRLSVTVDAFTATNASVNVAQFNGVTPLMGNGTSGTGAQRVAIASDNSAVSGLGAGATGSAVPSNAVYKGGIAKTALPTAATDGNLTGAMLDKFGRQVTLVGTIRDLTGTQTTTISASTSETTIVTAGGAGIFNDLVMLIVSNTSASTNTRIDFRDTTAGTVLFSLQSNGGQPPVGFALPVPIPQTTANTNWTAQCATSTTDVRIYAVFAKNK